MSDNVLQTLQQLVQDVLAPDIRELKVRISSLEKDMDSRFSAVDSRFNSLEKQMNLMERTILSAIGELKAQTELSTLTAVSALRERVAVLEAKHN